MSDVDNLHRPWEWHVKHVVIYSATHFKRSIVKAVETAASSSHSLQQQMEKLLSVKTREEYFELCDLIKSIYIYIYMHCKYIANMSPDSKDATEHIRRWAIHKKQRSIASGLNAACSLMDSELFFQTRRQTNTIEQMHWKSNSSLGKRISISKAIQM